MTKQRRYHNLLHGADVGLNFVDHFGYNLFKEADPLGWHSHGGYEFVYMLEGSCTYENGDGSRHPVKGGEFSFLPKGVSHRGKDDQNAPCLMSWIVFGLAEPPSGPVQLFTQEEYASLLTRCADYPPVTRHFTPNMFRMFDELKDAVSLWKQGTPDPLLAVRLRGIVMELLVSSVLCLENPDARTANDSVQTAMAFMAEHQAENISMADVAEHLGHSSSRFYQIFREQTGQTPNDHLLRLRLDHATQLLENTDLTLDRIASQTGFSSPQYFCRVFKRYTGRKPSEQRQT